MSRIGKKPIDIPAGVKVDVAGKTVNVEGKLGKLNFTFRPEMDVKVQDGLVVVERQDEERFSKAIHGLTRSLIANMVIGVSEGYEKKIEVYGVGYGAVVQGQTLTITCGKSHPEILDIPVGVTIDIQTPQARGDTDPAKFTVKGIDKQAVGEFAAKCRRTRPPEPYKGKGVRYADEYVRRKVGKAFAGGGA
ncbi:MAG: 50S ribosomal protein L6 [Planctomycetota bacterium]|nr:MAG: 50S ribosomal protein L6 [Planctomycetota bacterium]